MSYFKKVIEEISRDEKVPDDVWDKYVHTLDNLPKKTPEVKKRHWGGIITAAAVCMIAAGSLVCYTNPALASKIPILGEIFKQIEKSTTYSGDFSDKAEKLLSDEDNALISDEEDAITEKNYSAEDAGVKVSASEVLYDGISVFLTLKVDVPEGNLLNIPKLYTADDQTEAASVMYLWGDYEIPGVLSSQPLTEDSFYLEGKALDEHTYVGMVKMNLDQEELEEGVLDLTLSGIGYDDVTMQESENIDASHRFEGSWNLQVPFTLDTESTRQFTFDAKETEYGLEKLTISPYQIVTQISVPHTEREITREEYEEEMSFKTGGTDAWEISYEEYVEMMGKTFAESYTLVFNQDGEQITPRGGYGDGKSVFAVKGVEISKLQVLVFDGLDAWLDLDISELTEEAIEAAVNYEVVEIE